MIKFWCFEVEFVKPYVRMVNLKMSLFLEQNSLGIVFYTLPEKNAGSQCSPGESQELWR